MIAVGGHRVEVGEFGIEQVRVPAGAGPGDVGAKPALGHEADLKRPRPDHGAQLGLVLGTERAGEAEQDDVLEGHPSSSVETQQNSAELSRTRSTRASPSRWPPARPAADSQRWRTRSERVRPASSGS